MYKISPKPMACPSSFKEYQRFADDKQTQHKTTHFQAMSKYQQLSSLGFKIFHKHPGTKTKKKSDVNVGRTWMDDLVSPTWRLDHSKTIATSVSKLKREKPPRPQGAFHTGDPGGTLFAFFFRSELFDFSDLDFFPVHAMKFGKGSDFIQHIHIQ